MATAATMMAASRHLQPINKKRRAADRGHRAVPRVLGDAGQERADRALNHQIEASNLWNFFQAKNIRRTCDHRRQRADQGGSARHHRASSRRRRSTKQVDDWTKTAARYRSEPEAAGGKGEGTVELSRRAIEEQRQARHLRWRKLPSLRGGVGGVPDRHRAGFGDGHHRHVVLSYLCRRPRRARPGFHGDRAVRAARGASVLTVIPARAKRRAGMTTPPGFASARDPPEQPHRASGALRREHLQPLRIRSLIGSASRCAQASHISTCS